MIIAQAAAGVVIAFAVLATAASPATAQEASCTASFGGRTAASAASPGDAIPIDADSPLALTASSSDPISHIKIVLSLGPVDLTVIDRDVAPPEQTWTGSVNPSEVTALGVGLYRASAVTDTCTIEAWVQIQGRSPFTTVAGITATGLVAAGAALQRGGIKRSRRGVGGLKRALLGGVPTGIGACVLAQQHGVVPLEVEWISAFTSVPVAVGGLTARLSAARSVLTSRPASPSPMATPRSAPSPTSAGSIPQPTPASAPAEVTPGSEPTLEADAGMTPETATAAGTTATAAARRTEAPRSAYALLDSPPTAYAGVPVEVTIGISPEAMPGVVGGEMHIPPTITGDYVLCVDVIAEGFALGANETWRNDLSVTSADPYPTFRINLTPQSPTAPVEPRSIQAIYAVEGQTIGLAVRPIAVLKDQSVVTNASEEPPPPVTISVASDQEAPDITIRILQNRRGDPGLLSVNVDTRHGDVIKPGSFTVDIGQDSAAYAKDLVAQVSAREGQPGLYEFLLGTGKEIAAQLPQEFWDLIATVGAKTESPPTVLILSQEPYIPWELAVFEDPLDTTLPPFLSAQTVVGRWILADRGPELPPPVEVNVRSCAVISGSYLDPQGQRLLEAEEEAKTLQDVYEAASVNADMREVLECLKGIPPAELLHFAVHGRYDPGKPEEGLALVDGTILAAEQIRSRTFEAAPFVFLNACQVGSGDKALGDYTGMAAAFLYAGASGVVAPLWSVRDAIAKDVALRFYDQAFKGSPAAEIFRRERTAFQDSPDTTSATYMAYQFYGHPGLRVSRVGNNPAEIRSRESSPET